MQATLATIIMLWPGPAPLAVGDSSTDKPSLTVQLAAKPNGAAVVICPGGGYGFLANDHEGKQVADYYNSLGIHAFILKYRIVGKDRPGPLGKAPLLDTQRAIRLVRSDAKKYGIDPKKIGLMGFSAGGHLASTAGTHFDDGDANAKDPIDRVSCRPDWLVLAYPVISMKDGVTHGGSRINLLGNKPTAEQIQEFSNELQVTAKTPPTFLFHTSEDKAVLPENSLLFYSACLKAKVPVELHIYAKGQHGVGLGRDAKWTGKESSFSEWPNRLTNWLVTMKVIDKK
ncbi:MAG: alpha/beta hydrolase [Gemmataceae bacterium]